MNLGKPKQQLVNIVVMEKKIFISCPFNKFLKNNTFVDKPFREFTEELYEVCLQYTPNVFFALKREDYGAKPMPNYSCLRDFEEMKNADIVLAIPDDSMGSAVEIGWASAMRKNIVLILNMGQDYSPLITNIPKITAGEIIWYKKDLLSILPIIRNKLSIVFK